VRLLLIGERPVPIPEAAIGIRSKKQVKLNGGGIGRCAMGPPITVNVSSF